MYNKGGELLLLLFLLPIIFSCASHPSGSLGEESHSSFAILEEVEPLWSVFTDGVDYFHGKIVSPKIEFWALRIDLSASQMRIVVKGGKQLTINNEQSSTSTLTFSTRVSSFVRDNNLAAGINAVPFDVVSSIQRRPIQNMGIVISEGEMISPLNPRYDALVFYRLGDSEQSEQHNRAAIVSQSLIDSNTIQNIENAVSGFFQILVKGEPAQRILNLEIRHPRSAAGISANGEQLYLLVIDGRRKGSIGATERETALLLRLLGSEDGINFDGGGSSALALRYPDGKVRIANTPIHGRIAGRERAVAGCLGILLEGE